MSGILVYALHDDEGNFNNNSLGAISEAAKLAGDIGGDAAALVVGEVDDAACAALGKYGAAKVYRAKSVPEGLAQPIVDAMAKVITDDGYSYALFGGGLLGFEIGAGLTARLNAGVTMEVTAVKVADGKLVAERPVLQDSAIVDVGYVSEPGIIIGRLNAFDTNENGSGDAEVVDIEVELSEWSTKARMKTRGDVGDEGAVNIEDADFLVGAGRGFGDADNLSIANELAESLGGAVASTARSSTPAGRRTRRRSARRARPSRRSCTSRPASPARSSTRSECRTPRTSSRSTRTRTRRSSSSATSASWAISTRSCPS